MDDTASTESNVHVLTLFVSLVIIESGRTEVRTESGKFEMECTADWYRFSPERLIMRMAIECANSFR